MVLLALENAAEFLYSHTVEHETTDFQPQQET